MADAVHLALTRLFVAVALSYLGGRADDCYRPQPPHLVELSGADRRRGRAFTQGASL